MNEPNIIQQQLNREDQQRKTAFKKWQIKSTFSIQDKKLRDLDLAKEYPTLKDLMKEQGVSTDLADYWDKECELNPSNPRCLEYDD